jgi:hypothetical protein
MALKRTVDSLAHCGNAGTTERGPAICGVRLDPLDRRSYEIFGRLMSGEQFYINYSLNGEHYIMGPYHTRRFAMSHIDDVRRQPGVSNVFLGNKPPDDKSYCKRVPITAMEAR